MDGFGQDVVSLIKDSIPRCKVSGRITSSRKYGPGWSGSGISGFDKRMNSEICAFWKVPRSRGLLHPEHEMQETLSIQLYITCSLHV